MLKGSWGSAQRLATVAALTAVTLAGAGCTRLDTGDVGKVHGWVGTASLTLPASGPLVAALGDPAPVDAATLSPLASIRLGLSSLRDNLARKYGPSVQAVDDLVSDDDDTELAAERGTPNVTFGFSSNASPTQGMAETTSVATAQAPRIAPAVDAATAAQILTAATAQWNWAYEQGFFKSPSRPSIVENTVIPTGATEDGGVAAAIGHVTKSGLALFPKLNLTADIKVSPNLAGVAFTDNNPSRDIEAIVLHEGWHAEVFESPELNRFDGALLHNDPQAQTFWKAATWSTNQVTYKEVATRVPALNQALHDVGPNLSNIFEEAGADSAALTIMAHAKTEDVWKQRMLHMEGTRAHAGLYALGLNDPHETQESMAILARIGYDKLRALTPDQSRALIDAVAADGALLAAAKQGWLKNAQTLANASDTLTTLNPKSFTPATGFMMEKCYDQMKPAAQAWVQTPVAEREQIATAQINKVNDLWVNGGKLDYAYIAPGLTVDLPGHGTAPSYEIDPVATSSVPLTAQQKLDVASDRNVQAMQEWADMAQTLNYTSPAETADLGTTEPFRMMALWTTPTDRLNLMHDRFWGPDVTTFTDRLNAFIKARAASGLPTADAALADATMASPSTPKAPGSRM